jgi:hypothetical protein
MMVTRGSLSHPRLPSFRVTPTYSFVGVYRRFRRIFCLHHLGKYSPMTKAAGSYETSLSFYQTTRRHISDGSNRYSYRRVNIKPYRFIPGLFKYIICVLRAANSSFKSQSLPHAQPA